MDQDFLNELVALEDEAVGAFTVPSVEELDKLRILRNQVFGDAEFSEDTLDFAEIPNNAISITDKSALAVLKRLIESVYTAGITAIKYAYVDSDDNIRCGFEDKISAKQTLSFDGKINSTLISYGVSNPDLSEWDEPDSVISFAAPATVKPRNCNPAKSFQCGNSCQKLGRNCKKNPNSGQKGAIAQIVEVTKTKTFKANYDESSDKAALEEDFHRLYDLASGAADPSSMTFTAEENKEVNRFLYENYNDDIDTNKAKRITEAGVGMTDTEALALANWTSLNYESMNKRIFDPDSIGSDRSKKAVLNLDEMAAVALYKLPPATVAQIKKEAALKEEPFDESKPLSRYLTIDNPDAFAKRYQESLANGTPHMESTFFATTHLVPEEMGFFARRANVQYSVKAKLDGTGAGRYIDHFKNQASEGEILYPPMTKFKVKAVTQTKDTKLKFTKDEEEALDTWGIVESVLVLKQYNISGWKQTYKDSTGKPFPTKAKLKKMELSYGNAVNKTAENKNIFEGYQIELEEI